MVAGLQFFPSVNHGYVTNGVDLTRNHGLKIKPSNLGHLTRMGHPSLNLGSLSIWNDQSSRTKNASTSIYNVASLDSSNKGICNDGFDELDWIKKIQKIKKMLVIQVGVSGIIALAIQKYYPKMLGLVGLIFAYGSKMLVGVKTEDLPSKNVKWNIEFTLRNFTYTIGYMEAVEAKEFIKTTEFEVADKAMRTRYQEVAKALKRKIASRYMGQPCMTWLMLDHTIGTITMEAQYMMIDKGDDQLFEYECSNMMKDIVDIIEDAGGMDVIIHRA